MTKLQSLFFAVISVAFLFGVSVAIAHRSWVMSILAFLLFMATTAVGFIYKAKLRRKAEQSAKAGRTHS
jgi:NADH:ubiquinone oxidoreductase subunit 3 (subunit A)